MDYVTEVAQLLADIREGFDNIEAQCHSANQLLDGIVTPKKVNVIICRPEFQFGNDFFEIRSEFGLHGYLYFRNDDFLQVIIKIGRVCTSTKVYPKLAYNFDDYYKSFLNDVIELFSSFGLVVIGLYNFNK